MTAKFGYVSLLRSLFPYFFQKYSTSGYYYINIESKRITEGTSVNDKQSNEIIYNSILKLL